ncbi:MAG TPA: allantoinase AllB [Terracidiphilus sp.]|jgi:allantoinase|nr:allantoinase AllB [Terracidiphilus sp.]
MSEAFRSTRVVTASGVAPATVIAEDGRIAAIGEWDDIGRASSVHDFGDLVLLPGLVDSHVHINEPGRTEWEGFATATLAAAAGGVTTLVDMPLNCIPEVTSVRALEAKRAAAHGRACVDWAAWGGVVRGNGSDIQPLMEAGVRGFKCFLIHSGIDGFAWVDEGELRAALQRLRGTGLPLLAHAELPVPVDAATEAIHRAGADWRSYATYLASRPDEAEVEAIALLIRLADEYQTPVHIVHLSSAKALPLMEAARQRGVLITVETCTHYLWFAAEEIADGATEYKCAPPIRGADNREQLWNALGSGLIDMVTTDHSPCPPAMKRREAGLWDEAWGGIASLGLALPVLWTGMAQRGFHREAGLARVAEWLSAAPARLAGMSAQKGALRVGADADLAVFDAEAEWAVSEGDLFFRHKCSPYIGARLRGRIRETWLRGRRVFADGSFEGAARGKEWVGR